LCQRKRFQAETPNVVVFPQTIAVAQSIGVDCGRRSLVGFAVLWIGIIAYAFLFMHP
jgi:hypothetical protein